MAVNSSNLANVLMSIGGGLSSRIRDNRADQVALQDRSRKISQEEEDRALAKALQEMAMKKAQNDLDTQNFEISQRGKGEQALSDFTEASRVQPAVNEMKLGKPLSTTPTPYSLDELEKRPSATPQQLAGSMGLPRYAPYNKGVESTVKDISTTTQRDLLASQKEAELGLKQDALDSREKMANERNLLQQSLLDEKLKAGASQAELNRLAAEERARIAAESKGNQMKPEEKTQHALDVIDKINTIEGHPGFKGSVGMKGATQGFGLMKQPIAGTSEAGFNAEYNALRSLLTLDNIGKLKGVLSDTDMKILSQAASSLDLNMPEKDFRRELERVRNVMSRVSQNGQPSATQTIKTDDTGTSPITYKRVNGKLVRQ